MKHQENYWSGLLVWATFCFNSYKIATKLLNGLTQTPSMSTLAP